MKINVNGVDREATIEEIAVIEATQLDMQVEIKKQASIEKAALDAKESAKTKLEALGLTAAEIAALVG